MKKTIIVLMLINLTIISFSQTPEITWQNCFGTEESDNTKCIESTNNGYMIGINIETNGPDVTNYHGENDVWIIKTDTVGNIIWEKCFGGSESEGITKIIKLSESEFYLFCSTESSDFDITCDTNYGSTDFWVVKIDGLGNIIWDHCYGSPTTDYPRDAVVTPDGGLLFMGRIFSSGGDVTIHYGAYDIWLCKIDSLGTLEWEKTVGNEEIENALELNLISDTSFAFIGGYYESGGMIDCEEATTVSGADLWLIEMSLKDGNILNQYCYGGSYDDLGFHFEKIEDGYILVSTTNSNDGDVSGLHGTPGVIGTGDIWVVRIDEQGEIVWQKCLGGSLNEIPYYISQTDDGGYIVIGNTSSYNGDVTNNHSYQGSAWRDIWVVRLTAEGDIEWEHCYGGLGNDQFWGNHTIVKKDDYNYVFAAQTRMNSYDVQCNISGNIDAWVFEIKDCTQYPVGIVQAPIGPDTTCTVYDSTNMYAISPVTGAWGYGWQLIPNEAGTINGNDTQATVNWATGWEGTASIMARAMNDCDTSQWSEPHYTEVFTCLGIEEMNAGSLKILVYPNPASDYVVFELPTAHNYHAVIPNPGAGHGGGVRNPLTDTGHAGKPLNETAAGNSGDSSPAKAGFGMTVPDGTTIVIMDVYGQKIMKLTGNRERTVWNTEKVEAGVYFYKVELERNVISGKIVIWK